MVALWQADNTRSNSHKDRLIERFPPHWIPHVALDENKVEWAVRSYQWASASGPFRWVEKDNLILIGRYLVYHQTVPYWEIILKGGVPGYSLYLHELAELTWYAKEKCNPFDSEQQIRHYPVAHSWGLLVEHRFLQVVAWALCYDFSLRELILGNPHGDPPERDWDDVRRHWRKELSRADTILNPSHEPRVREFYRRLGFQEVR